MKNAGLSSILIAVVLLVLGVIAEAQQPTKDRRLDFSHLVPLRASVRQYRQSSVRSAMLRVRTSLSTIDTLILITTGSLPWLMSWSVSKLTCSSRPGRLLP